MITVSLSQASQSLARLVERTLADSEETVIVSDNGSVVMIDREEWENLLETLKILRDKRSVNALLEGHQSRDEGKKPVGVSVEEAFHDL